MQVAEIVSTIRRRLSRVTCGIGATFPAAHASVLKRASRPSAVLPWCAHSLSFQRSLKLIEEEMSLNKKGFIADREYAPACSPT